jgi:hypothetical protein
VPNVDWVKIDSHAVACAAGGSDPSYDEPGPGHTRSRLSGTKVTPRSGSSLGSGKLHPDRQVTLIGVAHTVATSPPPVAVALTIVQSCAWIHNHVGKFTIVASVNSSMDEGDVEMIGEGSFALARAALINGGRFEADGSGTVSQKIHRYITLPVGVLADGRSDSTPPPPGGTWSGVGQATTSK